MLQCPGAKNPLCRQNPACVAQPGGRAAFFRSDRASEQDHDGRHHARRERS